ncbi:uncharacterized protein N7511_008442 [Penicillium nucicola]|uniref:uncharacterized protein n=1 Tax=Penicillium nucicola TaxID=1850975 RepID=UPI002544FA5D|nr:uncharacterized protein N7511_008442 [Penicillium nucicola]KAJ5751477.1 hypothetical protein N7511_008442 [Penicillium nucicola]
MVEMFIHPLTADQTPAILFRAECSSNSTFREGYLCARSTTHADPPSWQDFDDHLSWKRQDTRFISFGTWRRAMQRRKQLENENKIDIIVIAVWAKGLAGVYSAEDAASRLEYSDIGRNKLYPHHDEYLLEGGLAADEYRIVAVFEGGGRERDVIFECPFYRIRLTIPNGFFLERRSNNALGDIEDEIYRHSGVRDDQKRDELVKAIAGITQFFPALRYEYSGHSENPSYHQL